MNYGRALRLARAARGLGQADVARRAQVDPSYVSLIESGQRNSSIGRVLQLAAALDIPPHLLNLLAAGPGAVDLNSPAQQALSVELVNWLADAGQ